MGLLRATRRRAHRTSRELTQTSRRSAVQRGRRGGHLRSSTSATWTTTLTAIMRLPSRAAIAAVAQAATHGLRVWFREPRTAPGWRPAARHPGAALNEAIVERGSSRRIRRLKALKAERATARRKLGGLILDRPRASSRIHSTPTRSSSASTSSTRCRNPTSSRTLTSRRRPSLCVCVVHVCAVPWRGSATSLGRRRPASTRRS